MLGSPAQRVEMVERLRLLGIADERVLQAMGEVPREGFVVPERAPDAYLEMPLPIGLGQTISAPFIVASSISALRLSPRSAVLEVGTGSGYGAAVLSRCCRNVVTIERHAELATRASRALAEYGDDNVEVRQGDGTAGAPDRAPFDGIVVTAMASERVPDALMAQLAAAGTLICPVGGDGNGDLVRYHRGMTEPLGEVRFVPLVSEQQA